MATEAHYSQENLPHWALYAFSPVEGEKGRISFYEVDADVTPQDIASALAFRKNTVPRWFFMGVPRADVEGLGFALHVTRGLTHHPEVNERHIEIDAGDLPALSGITMMFLQGEPIIVDKREVDARLIAHAREDRIDWLATAKGGNEPAWKQVRDFAKRQAIILKGQSAETTE